MTDAPNRLYLLDASNYIFRAFHSTSPAAGGSAMTTSNGLPTNAILVFTNMVRKLLREHEPTHFAAVFDVRGTKTFRHEKYTEYKANRKATPSELKVQFPYFRPLVKALGLHVVEKPGYEADDVIATLCEQAKAEGLEAVIVSSDKDLYQLLTTGVQMYDGMKDRWIELEHVMKKFHVGPEKVLEVQALIGDSVDNIPGIRGIGPKTAAKLVTTYGGLEGIYEHVEELKGKQKERIIEGREDAFLSRELAALHSDVELGEIKLESYRRAEVDLEALLPLLSELEFRSLQREYRAPTVPTKAIERHIVNDTETLDKLTSLLSTADHFSAYALTGYGLYTCSELVGIAIATDATTSWYIPLAHRTLGAPTQLSAESVCAALGPVLESRAPSHLVTHSVKELKNALHQHNISITGCRLDIELASYLVNATQFGAGGHSLENIAQDRMQTTLPATPKAIQTGRTFWSEEMVDEAMRHAGARVEAMLGMAGELREDLEASKLQSLHDDVEVPLAIILAAIEAEGIRVDRGVLEKLSTRFGEMLTNYERECHSLAGGPFNIGSPKQLAQVLFEKLELPVQKRTKTGPSTDASVLEALKGLHPIVDRIHDWRSVSKLKSTYTDVLPRLADTKHRIHTNFRQAVAATGRLSSYEPNLQNIPIRTEEGRRIRDAFIPKDGMLLLSADYSQVELRVLAHLSSDPGLTKAFAEGVDIHRRTASEVFEVSEDDVTFEQRSAAKAINFGLMYGMGPFRLSKDLGIEFGEAKHYISRYFERFPAVKAFMDGTIELGRTNGYVSTILGRRRYVSELRSKNHNRRSAAERAAINTPVQGSAADLIKLAMLKIDKTLREGKFESKMILQVHDELVFEVPEDELATLVPLVKGDMENVYPLAVPLTVSAASGKNWNEAH